MKTTKGGVIINEKDNVGVSLAGTENIPAGHKYALREIKKGEYIVKYGEIIGQSQGRYKARAEWGAYAQREIAFGRSTNI